MPDMNQTAQMMQGAGQDRIDPSAMAGAAQQQGPKVLSLPQQNPIPPVDTKEPKDVKKEYDVEKLIKIFSEYRSFKQKILKSWRLIRSLYKGDFWQVFKKYLKDYTLTPDWNYLEYTVQAYLNSIYSGAFIGTLTPVREEDTEYIEHLNAFISYNWNKWGMKNKFLHIGENGELYNLGAVRVDWNQNKLCVSIKALSPDEVYLDPNVDDYKEGHSIFIERSIDINKLKNDERFSKEVEKYMKGKTRYDDKTKQYRIEINNNTTSDNQMVSLLECFVRNDEGTIDQIFILDEAVIIYGIRLDLKEFPIAIYTPSRPEGSPYGDSKLIKILNTVITLNLLDSMEATQPYRLLNRVRLVNVDGRINMRSFSKYGATPGASFEVKGDPRDIVHYVEVPTIPDLTPLKNRLENSIFQITGVDPYYKGRMTNSIQTTGATQAFQARVTMLTDNSRITLLEEFCENITKIIIDFYTNFSGEQEYQVPKLSATGTNAVISTYKLRFNEVPYNYMINASVLLPMNQANLFESAKALYEMQGQYNFKTQIISEADLVRYSDFPQKDLLLQRIEKDKQSSTAEDLISDLTNFASIFSKLLAQGLSEEQAAQEAIQMLIEEKNAMMQDPSLGRGFE